MRTLVAHKTAIDGTRIHLLKLNPKPLLVWNNPVSGTRIGILAMFTRNDRPDVIAQFSFNSPTTVIHEFHNFYGTDLEMKRGESILWKPSTCSTKWNELPNADKGAETPQQRLIQMRRLAETFVIEDNFGWDKKELNQLRLLPTPVYRYGNPDEEVVDGAVFAFAKPVHKFAREVIYSRQDILCKYKILLLCLLIKTIIKIIFVE